MLPTMADRSGGFAALRGFGEPQVIRRNAHAADHG
jgi:hypothetical protein